MKGTWSKIVLALALGVASAQNELPHGPMMMMRGMPKQSGEAAKDMKKWMLPVGGEPREGGEHPAGEHRMPPAPISFADYCERFGKVYTDEEEVEPDIFF